MGVAKKFNDGNPITADGDYDIVLDSELRRRTGPNTIYANGTFGGGTLAMKISPEGTTNFFALKDADDVAISFTVSGYENVLADGEFLRATLSGATNPSINLWLV